MENFYNEHDKLFVAVDCIVFGFDEGELRVLMGKRKMNPGRGEWSLYGGFVGENESVDDAAKRVLYGLTGLKDLYEAGRGIWRCRPRPRQQGGVHSLLLDDKCG